jgi:hypothetical protein
LRGSGIVRLRWEIERSRQEFSPQHIEAGGFREDNKKERRPAKNRLNRPGSFVIAEHSACILKRTGAIHVMARVPIPAAPAYSCASTKARHLRSAKIAAGEL